MGTIPTPNIEGPKKKSFINRLITQNMFKLTAMLGILGIALYVRINMFIAILQDISYWVLWILGCFFGLVILIYMAHGLIINPIKILKEKKK